MSDKHVCQLRNGEKAAFLNELRDIVNRMAAIEQTPSSQPKYDPNNVPNFLKEKLPRFKKNLDLQPLITHTSADEVRFTSDVKLVKSGGEDPNAAYALLPGPGNPFKPPYMTSDPLCNDFCNKAIAAEKIRLGKKVSRTEGGLAQPVCLHQAPNDAPRDPQGHMYNCNHDRRFEGVMVCNPEGGQQSYLCTRHVYPQQ